MNKKGYTLVELIGVIVLLAIIITLVSTGIVNVIKSTNKKIDDNTKKILYNQADAYLSEHVDLRLNGVYRVSVSTLIEDDKISSNFLSSYTQDQVRLSSCIIINYSNGTPTY